MKLSWFALPLALGASAASIEERATCVKTINTYDELTTPNVVDALKPVGTYKGLKYGGFSLSVCEIFAFLFDAGVLSR